MRRDLPEVFEINTHSTLPASDRTVVKALRPLLTDDRLDRIEKVLALRTRSVAVVVDGLIDPHNVSAVMRSAEAFGVQELHVIENAETLLASSRVAKGSERWLEVTRHSDPIGCVKALRARGFSVYVADANGQLALDELGTHKPVAVCFGNEHEGPSAALRAMADGTFAIPMRGFVESLNVSVAAAITLYTLTQGKSGTLSERDKDALRARFIMASLPRAREVLQELLNRIEDNDLTGK
jgi:tRNA (guanosine-2'-O-)-methyltransferase